MKKNKRSQSLNSEKISPEKALQFLEDIRIMTNEKDEPTKAISIRVPENILRAIKLRAQADGKKYQSLILEYLRQSLRTR